MFSFKRKNPATQTSHTLIRRFWDKLDMFQRGITNWTNRKTRHWTKTQQLTFLFAFCLLFGGTSLLLLVGKSASTISGIESFSPPPGLHDYQHQNDYQPDATDSLIVSRFIQMADSLQATPEGIQYLREFFRQRPGFLDSLDLMRRFYPSIPNFKKLLYEP